MSYSFFFTCLVVVGQCGRSVVRLDDHAGGGNAFAIVAMVVSLVIGRHDFFTGLYFMSALVYDDFCEEITKIDLSCLVRMSTNIKY